MAILDRALGRPAAYADLTVRNEGSTANAHLAALLQVARKRMAEPVCLDASPTPRQLQQAHYPAGGDDGTIDLTDDSSG